MMRPLALTTLMLGIAGLTACDIELDDGSGVNEWENPFAPSLSDGALRARSTNFMRYEGIYVPEESSGYGVAGMAGMTCQLYVNDGYTGTDVDLANGSDIVDDGRPVDDDRPDLGVLVLGHGPMGIHVVGMPSGEIQDQWDDPGVVTAKFDDQGGFWAVRDDGGDCVVDHHSSSDDVVTDEIPDRFCDGDASVEATPDGLVVADEAGSVVVDAAGVTTGGLRGHHITFSDTMHGYHVSDGQKMTFEVLGAPLWTTDVGGEITSHADLGDTQVLSVAQNSGASRLVVVDSLTGEIVSDQTVDRPAGTVYGSDDGRTVVVATDSASDAYSVEY